MTELKRSKVRVWRGKIDTTEHGYDKSAIKRKTLSDGSHRYVWKRKSEEAKKRYNSDPKIRANLAKGRKLLKTQKKKKTTTKKATQKKKTKATTQKAKGITSLFGRLFK